MCLKPATSKAESIENFIASKRLAQTLTTIGVIDSHLRKKPTIPNFAATATERSLYALKNKRNDCRDYGAFTYCVKHSVAAERAASIESDMVGRPAKLQPDFIPPPDQP